MRDIHDRDVRIHAGDHTLHLGNIRVPCSEVRGKRDNGHDDDKVRGRQGEGAIKLLSFPQPPYERCQRRDSRLVLAEGDDSSSFHLFTPSPCHLLTSRRQVVGRFL